MTPSPAQDAGTNRLPVVTSAIATTLAIFLIIYTEQYVPAGSPFAPAIVALLVAAHLPLLGPRVSALRPPRWLNISPIVVGWLAAALLVATAGWFTWRGNVQIFAEPIRPKGSAQLGLMTQVVSRMEQALPIYGFQYPRDGFETLNGYCPGLVVPFAAVRSWGLDWRYASLGGLVFLAAVLIAGMTLLIQRSRQTAVRGPFSFAMIALMAAGVGWLVVPPIGPFLHWGHTMPIWPLIAGLGLSIALRWPLITAVLAGLLSTTNPAWIVMLTPIGCHLYKEKPETFPVTLFVMLFLPFIAYGYGRGEFGSMLEGILNPIFYQGTIQDKLLAWRFTTIHGLGDLWNLRIAIYLCALILLGALSVRICKESRREHRIELLVFCGFILVFCGPAAFHFHWMAHAIFAAGMIPAAMMERYPATVAAPVSAPARFAPAIAAAVVILIIALPVASRVRAGFPGTIDRRPNFFQPPLENLVGGFNVPSADHAWGRETTMEVGFALDRVQPGIMEVELGTLGADFAPYNPVFLYVNGHLKGLFRALPGRVEYARFPVSAEDLHIGFNVLTLEARWARTPRSLNLGDDHRTVSVMYRGLRLIPRPLLPENENIAALP